MTAFIDIDHPTNATANQYLAVCFTPDDGILDLVSGPTVVTALDRMREIFPEAQITDNAAEALLVEIERIN